MLTDNSTDNYVDRQLYSLTFIIVEITHLKDNRPNITFYVSKNNTYLYVEIIA